MPQTWYQGIGEKAASGWLTFHNAVENLYVYDPRGYFRDKIVPAINNALARGRYFINQRELDFYEFVDPVTTRTERDREGPLWLLAGAFAILFAIYSLRRILDPAHERKEALRIGRRSLHRVRKILLLRGVNPILLATETDCAIHAAILSETWGEAVTRVADTYQSARYSGKKVTSGEVAKLKRASRKANRPPRN